MFKSLRNKFILTNMLTTTAILVVAFIAIFAFSSANVRRIEPPIPREFSKNSVLRRAFREEIEREREGYLVSLAVTLIIVGISIETLVFILSYFLANKSVKPVEEAYEKQREFIANASHELKTPIASVRANFEALGATEKPWADNIECELTRASDLVNSMLLLARTDGRKTESEKKKIDIAELIKGRIKYFNARLDNKKLDIDLPSISFVINKADFEQIFDILLDNAIKYSNKTIKICLNDNGFSIENDGKMIPAEKIDRIFDRFYQVDKSASGTGLGLAIAKSIADQNKWNICAESDKNSTKFSVLF
ncbi:MAG: HAMP domain-containing histidine kinase [Candidatus Saccharibacteria bacterium]|nr:HAMP domain-containing histidine kinase [Candidatus Saccharibacteria bacterium]